MFKYIKLIRKVNTYELVIKTLSEMITDSENMISKYQKELKILRKEIRELKKNK